MTDILIETIIAVLIMTALVALGGWSVGMCMSTKPRDRVTIQKESPMVPAKPDGIIRIRKLSLTHRIYLRLWWFCTTLRSKFDRRDSES